MMRLLEFFLSFLLVLGPSNGFSPASARPSPIRLVDLPNPIRLKTRQSAFFGGKGNAKRAEEPAVNDDKAEKASAGLNFFNRKAEAMPDLTRDLRKEELDLDKQEQEMAISLAGAELNLEKLLVPLGITALAAGLAVAINYSGVTPSEITSTFASFQADPQGTLQSSLEGLGPLAVVYFGVLYVVAELLAIPATPLTLSAGYLFGLYEGALVVLAAGTVSAMLGFFIGKLFLRSWVENLLEENPKFKKLDTAIGAEGFKLLVLVRLSPIFPFSLLNYTYGASSIPFPTFVAGTLLGFTPSTLGYVYTGLVGKELLLGEGTQPWYIYAAGITALLGFLKVVTDVATEIVEAIDDE